MYTVDTGVSPACVGTKFSFLRSNSPKKQPRNPKRGWYCPFHLRGEDLHPGARHLPLREVGRRFSLPYCRWTDSAMSWVTLTYGKRENIPKYRKVRRPSRVAHRQFSLLSSRSLIRRLPPSVRHDPAKRKPLRQLKKWRKPCEHSWSLSLEV